MQRVVVVGAGVVGAAIAYELSQVPDLEVMVFEQTHPAQEATGAALGICMGAISRKTKGRGWQLRHQSLQRYRTLIPELEQITGQNIPGNTQGILMLFGAEEADSPGAWQRLQHLRQRQGYALHLLQPDQLAAEFPWVTTDNLTFAVYSPDDRQIHPQAFTQALLQAAQLRGVIVHPYLPVKTLSWHQGTEGYHCQAVETALGSIATDLVIIAAGLGSMALTRQLRSEIKLMPVLGQAFEVQLPNPLPSLSVLSSGIKGENRSCPVVTFQDVHVVPLDEGQCWVGATLEFPDPQGDLAHSALGEDPELTTEQKAEIKLNSQLEHLWQRAIAFFPALKQAEIIRSWSGLRPRPIDRSAPVIEPLPNWDNVMVATGHYRNGIFLAPATAQQVRSWCEAKLGLTTKEC